MIYFPDNQQNSQTFQVGGNPGDVHTVFLYQAMVATTPTGARPQKCSYRTAPGNKFICLNTKRNLTEKQLHNCIS